MMYEIEQINVKFMGNIKYITIQIVDFIVGTTPDKLLVTIYDEFGRKVYQVNSNLDSADYNQWGQDDKFIAECVCKSLDLQLV